MARNPFFPQQLVGRKQELEHICRYLREDKDFLLVGVPGIGRRTLIRAAALRAGARMLELDCLRCRSGKQFLRCLADEITRVFATPAELALIQRWAVQSPLSLDQALSRRDRLLWTETGVKEWAVLEALLTLPQHLAEGLGCQVVVVLHNFPHMRSWDRQGKWETYLRQEVTRQSRVSYALVATVEEPWVSESPLPVMHLPPLTRAELEPWLIQCFATEGLKFEPDTPALDLFLDYVQGHLGDAIALAQRIWLDYHSLEVTDDAGILPAHLVHRNMLALVQDLSATFEALLLMLPPIQAHVLESLALDPTDSPQSRAYIKAHGFSRGGSLQGALTSLEQKGLIYGARFGYRLALPLLDFWLKQRLTQD